MSFRRPFCFVALFIAMAFSGCMAPTLQMAQSPEAVAGPRTVAILPFSLETDGDALQEHPETIFRRVFYSYFSYLGYRDLPLGEIDRRLKEAGHRNAYRVHRLPASELRRILGVDAVILGRVTDANNFTGGLYAETRLEAELQMRDLVHDRLLWKIDHHEIELSGIAQSTVVNMVQDQIDNSETGYAYFRAAETFSVKAMEKIPDPQVVRPQKVELPRIRSLEANIQPGKVVRAGDIIEVHMVGDPGHAATFDIGNAHTHLKMKEIEPGLYWGTYKIQPDDRIGASLIIGRLVNANGMIRKKILKRLITQVRA